MWPARALDARIYFRGFAGDSSLTMRLKFDVSDFEVIVIPPVSRSLIHSYSDTSDCECNLNVYALEEILAEKLRSWIQRTRSRDLFDAVKIVREHGDRIRKRTILDAFFGRPCSKESRA